MHDISQSFRFHFFKFLFETFTNFTFKNHILSWTISITCLLKNLIHLICNDIKIEVFFRKVSIFVNFRDRVSQFQRCFILLSNLFEMFNEKFKKSNLFQNKKNVSFREFFSKQLRITIYFKFTINQKSSINQNLKKLKLKSSNQHIFAKSIRIVFNKKLFQKLIVLSCKSTNVFYVKIKFLQIKSKSSKSRTFAKISFFLFILFRLFSIFLFAFAFVSIISITRINCINVYEQIVSIIDRVI